MHYYKFNIGDYRKDTAHLSRLEHSIYRDLIDWYYLEETPIPLETQSVMRRLRLVSEEEAKALENVLSDFFLKGEGWIHKRIEAEITDYHAMEEKNRANGKLGGRPKKTQSVPSGMPDETQSKGNQEPITINQEPIGLPPTEVVQTGKPVCPPCPIAEIINVYHETLPTNPRFQVRNEARDGHIRSRWKQFFTAGDFTTKEQGIDCFRWLFAERVKPSKFLTGQADGRNGSKPFAADLEWLMRPTNFAKVIEGKYL